MENCFFKGKEKENVTRISIYALDKTHKFKSVQCRHNNFETKFFWRGLNTIIMTLASFKYIY